MNQKKAFSYRMPLILLSILLAITVGTIIVIWCVFGSNNFVEQYKTSGFAMGTYIEQTLYSGDSSASTKTAAAANRAVTDLDEQISWRIEGSDIALLNDSAGSHKVTIKPATASLLQIALDVAQKTDGAFDPTILPLSRLWNFDENVQTVPDQAEIHSRLEYVDYRQLQVDRDASTAFLKQKHAAVDLGSVGKGAACDAAVAVYNDAGIPGIIAVGGSIGVAGQKPDGSDWKIGIRNPASGEDTGASMGILSIGSGFVSTSGTYEKTFQQNGVTYHHILDPKTGYPADTGLVSVTVHCDSGALSDALSTTCILLGLERSLPLLESYGAGAVFITTDHQVIVTESIRDALEITNSDFTLQP